MKRGMSVYVFQQDNRKLRSRKIKGKKKRCSWPKCFESMMDQGDENVRKRTV